MSYTIIIVQIEYEKKENNMDGRHYTTYYSQVTPVPRIDYTQQAQFYRPVRINWNSILTYISRLVDGTVEGDYSIYVYKKLNQNVSKKSNVYWLLNRHEY